MTLVVNLPRATRSKAQMVAPRGAVRVMEPITPLFTPGGCLALPGFALLLLSLLSQACSGLGGLNPVFVNVTGLGLLLAWTWSCKALWLQLTPSEVPD